MATKSAKVASSTKIYRDSKEFLSKVLLVVKDFPKAQRYIVGDRLESLAIDNLHLISEVYINRDLQLRVSYMMKMQSNIELLNTLLEVSGEHQWIKGAGRLANLLLILDNIGRQSTAWKGSLLKALERQNGERSQSR